MDLNDALIDQIGFRAPDKGSLDKVAVYALAGHWLTASILLQIGWFALPVCAAAVAQQHGFGLEEAGFEYPTDREPDEETFEGVRMQALDEEILVSGAAFDRLMLRYFEQMVDIAKNEGAPVLSQSWWPEYLANVEVVRQRVHESTARS